MVLSSRRNRFIASQFYIKYLYFLVLLNNQTTIQSSQRPNPFDRATTTERTSTRFWRSIVSIFRSNPSISVNTAINEGVAVASPSSSHLIISVEPISSTNPVFSGTSNNVLNTNLSGSFKADDDFGPHHCIYEPIGDSNFIDPPSNGGIGVVALPNSHNSNSAPNHSTSDNRYFI